MASHKTILMVVVTVAASLWLASPNVLAQTVLYVDDDAASGGDGLTWSTAFQYLQDALSAASTMTAPVEIRVAAGIYYPDQGQNQTPGNRRARFELLDGVMLMGGYAGQGAPDPDERDWVINKAVLSGDIDQDGVLDADNSLTVVLAKPDVYTAALDGFTITGGYADKSGLYYNSCGGGMFIDFYSYPVVQNCHFLDNYAMDSGGAIFYTDDPDDPYVQPIVNCVFQRNKAGSVGGAIVNVMGKMAITNCTIFDNEAMWRGGGFYHGSHLEKYTMSTVTNTIFWNNTAKYDGNQIKVWHGWVKVNYCDVEGGWAGIGNIDIDPLFVDTPNGDLRLAYASPCIDMGDNSAVPQDITTDLDGNPRIADGDVNGIAIVDMGAYEVQPLVATLDILPGDDPNMFVPNKKGQGRIPMAIFGSQELAADDIDPDTIKIAGSVSPVKVSTDKDVDGDGLVDLFLHFSRRALIDAMSLDTYDVGAVVDVTVTAKRISDARPIMATDSIVIAGSGH